MSSPATAPGPFAEEHIVVKFYDHRAQLDPQDVEQSLRQQNLGPWDDLKRRFPGSTISPAMAKVWDRIDHHVQLAAARTPGYSPPDFKAFCIIRVPVGTDPRLLVPELRTWPAIEYAYPVRPPRPPSVNDGPNPCEWLQDFHQGAGVGIDAYSAWDSPGGDGAGQVFADIEFAAMLNHEDLIDQNITLLQDGNPMSTDPFYINHGTAVLGIIYAADNQIDGVGIVPNAQQGYVLPSTIAGQVTYAPEVIVEALNIPLPAGSILLIEQQATPYGGPVEWEPLYLQAIQLAVAQGVTVIEPAGNVPNDLDAWTDPFPGPLFGTRRLDRTSPDFIDSGAIMVGASTSGNLAKHARGDTSFGNRIDCYAPGTMWTCALYDATNPPPSSCPDLDPSAIQMAIFGGTSGASAIIAGAAISAQGMAYAQTGSTLSPAALRALLSLEDYGTTSLNGTQVDKIGVMPDLSKIAGYFSS